MMNILLLVASGIVAAGLEPFLPVGSAVLGFAAVIGVRRQDWWGLIAVFVAGVGRDVSLVLPLGGSAIATVLIFAACGATVGRINRPALVAMLWAGIGTFGIETITRHSRPSAAALGTAVWTILLLVGASLASGRSDRIRLRG